MALVPEGGRRGGLARFAMVLQGCGPTNLQPGASHQGILASLPIPPNPPKRPPTKGSPTLEFLLMGLL